MQPALRPNHVGARLPTTDFSFIHQMASLVYNLRLHSVYVEADGAFLCAGVVMEPAIYREIAMRSHSKIALVFVIIMICIAQYGCALSDWWAYNVSGPPQTVLIPHTKLLTLWKRFQEKAACPDEDSSCNKDLSLGEYATAVKDSDWGAAFEDVGTQVHGWQPDFCTMFEARRTPPANIDKAIEGAGNVPTEDLRKAFWKSYLRNVYYDSFKRTPTYYNHSSVQAIVDTLLAAQDDFIKANAHDAWQKEGIYNSLPLFKSFGRLFTRPPEVWRGSSEADYRKVVDLARKLENTAPTCGPQLINAGEWSYGTQRATTLPGPKDQKKDSNEPNGSESRDQDVSQMFLARLLESIDDDHSELLVDFNGETPGMDDIRWRIIDWQQAHESCCRSLTVSKVTPASLAPSIKKSLPELEKKEFFLKTGHRAQKEFVNLGRELLTKGKEQCEKTKRDDCGMKSLAPLTELMMLLAGADEKPNPFTFNERQPFELTLSSILNSPDNVNRLQYLATYIYFFEYPYPGNGTLVLEQDFWRRFKSQISYRLPSERNQAIAAALENAWRDMRVRVEDVETLVQHTPLQEIAAISREANQSVDVKLQPSIDITSLAKEKSDAPLASSSSLKTTVTEKLLKELDRRSSWLNSNRNLLRITQRGLESVSIAGSLKEKITLHIPTALTLEPVIEIEDGKIVVGTASQPLYWSVPAIGITLATVREPYHFKRSAAEKYGLPDSADAYEVVAVSRPVRLVLWQSNRYFARFTTEDLNVGSHPQGPLESGEMLRFYHARSGVRDRLLVSYKDSDKFSSGLRTGLYNLLHPPPENPGPKEQIPENPGFKVQCSLVDPPAAPGGAVGKGEGEPVALKSPQSNSGDKQDKKPFFIVINKSDSPLDDLWIGKENSDRQLQPFDGNENETFRAINSETVCNRSAS
jgi:hypothetical protein